ncbi:Protein SABRE-like protein [Vigna angularis]|uniref:Protein SABRE-like protein n=1 Tax=Phaseolus angularis TaxID=3914 RepID=A0A8T0K3Q8_PHAAN|nr:Protein SABRE-like protein [Vigna angularis]
MGESAKVEVLRTMSEIEQTKTMIRTTKIRLVAARKMKEAAEAFALVEINALSNNENESLPGNQITLSFKEYTVLTCKAHDAEEQSRKRVANAMLEVEETNLSNMNILKRVEEAKEEGRRPRGRTKKLQLYKMKKRGREEGGKQRVHLLDFKLPFHWFMLNIVRMLVGKGSAVKFAGRLRMIITDITDNGGSDYKFYIRSSFALLSWILSRVLGASVGFCVSGFNSLKDVELKFKKGGVESIYVGEIKLSFRRCLVDHGSGFSSWDPKLQLIICNLEVVTRPPIKSTEVKKKKPKKSSGASSGKGKGKGKWKTVSTIAKYFSLSVTNIALKTPKFSVEIGKLNVDISKEAGSESDLVVRVQILPILFNIIEPQDSNQVSDSSGGGSNPSVQATVASTEKTCATFVCEKFSVSCTFGHDREIGIAIKSVEISIGDISVNSNEGLLEKKKSSSESSSDSQKNIGSSDDPNSKKPPSNKQEKISGYISKFPQTLFKEVGSSILEISSVKMASFVYVPVQSVMLIRAETEIKIGRSQCNIVMSRIKPWLLLKPPSKQKKLVIREEPSVAKPKSTDDSKTIVCLKSTHVTANNTSKMGTAVHSELCELSLKMANENQECLEKSIFGAESNSASIFHIAKICVDWGKKDIKSSEKDAPKCVLSLSVVVTSLAIYLSFERIESFISTAISFQVLFKSLSGPKKKSTTTRSHSSKSSGKGTQMVKFNLEKCSVYVLGETGIENAVVPDPKRVNYGSQGGRVIISVSADGTPRTATVISTVSDEYQKLKYCISLQIIDLKLSVNKEKRSKQVELAKARCIYQEYYDETRPVSKVALFDIRYIKFVQRLGGLKENAACSLFSATEISLKWEPDVHLSLIELVLQLKLALHNSKLRERGNEQVEDVVSDVKDFNKKNEVPLPSGHSEKKKDSVFAVDVEMLKISGVLGDGVDAMVQVKSIFSENARIGVLLEGLLFYFNGARLVKSSRMQVSRIPSKSATAISDAKGATIWDWVIQGLDVHICMPFRLELRAIDDALEDMLRALKLIVAAKTNMIFPVKKDSSKAKKPSSVKFGCVKFFLRKLTFDIEEEPLQGWLDEHYPLLKKEVGELAVRLNFLDDFISKVKKDPNSTDDTNNCTEEKKIYINDIEVDLNDPSVVESMREDIYRRTFRSYYQSCQNIKFYEGSGAYKNDEFQSGFKLGTSRSFVLSAYATDLDVTLTKIDGGEDGMIEILRTLDPVCRELEIPFSRLYGANILLNTGSLVAQIRDYTFPLFAGTSGKCEGRLVMAQQATSFQPQMVQEVYVGEWRKVSMLRSATGTTPPMKTYTDLTLRFQKGEVSFGVGYEPVFADISYAFTVVLRRANLSLKTPGPLILPPKKEKSLPWWDDMRNYIHGRITLLFSETHWNILGSSDPYEKFDKLVLLTRYMEIQQSDGRIFLSSEDFNIYLTSLESLATKNGAKIPPGVYGPFFEVPVFILEVIMDWGCESDKPLNHYLFSLPIEGKPREFLFDPFRSTALSIKFSMSFRSFPPPSDKQSSSLSVAKDSTEGDANVHQPPRTSQNASPTINLGSHDLSWLTKFGTLMYLPPHKLRFFSRFPRYGCPRIVRSGNLALDKVITEFMMRIDGTPIRVKNVHLHDDDPAKGLTFSMTKLKVEVCFGRGKQKFTFECYRPLLDLVYLGVDLHMPKVFLSKEDCSSITKLISMKQKGSQTASKKTPSEKGCMTQKDPDDGFFLSGDYFTIRKQSPKADPDTLIAWHEAGKIPSDNTYVRPQRGNRNETDEQAQSDPSDDEGYNVVIADSCQRVFVYGLKLLWNIENRNAICFWVASLSKAAAPAKPSPSRQYVQRKLHEGAGTNQDEDSVSLNTNNILDSPSSQTAKNPELPSSPPQVDNVDNVPSSSTKNENADEPEEGTRHFMVNIVEPQFNLHSEDAHGRFLLAAVSGRILAQSYHSVLQVGLEMIEQGLNKTEGQSSEYQPEIAWKRWELSVMLEHVQAHVAPTDVDLGAGVQWLPKIRRGSPKVMRTGALLERVFMPCDMYFQFTRHKGGTPELKVTLLYHCKIERSLSDDIFYMNCCAE